MALRDQPYLPLYVQDFLTDEKLAECSAQATGVYIRIMCLMHKSETYGKILLKQKHKQTDNQIKNFALLLAKHFPYPTDIIESSITELVDEGVLMIDGDCIAQKRMINDNELSIKRSLSGRKGGERSLGKDKGFAQAKPQANPENENENENEDIIIKIEKEGVGEKEREHEYLPKSWKEDFNVYLSELNSVYDNLILDQKFIEEQEEFHPGVDVVLSLKKAYTNFWSKEAGWKFKKKKRIKTIDWRDTLTNAIGLNKVYKPKDLATTVRKGTSLSQMQEILDEHSKAQLYGSN